MLRPNTCLQFLLGLALSGATFSASPAWARTNELWIVANNRQSEATASLCPGEFVGQQQVMRYFLNVGVRKYVFVVPDTLQAQTTSSGIVDFTSRDMTYFISVRLVESPPAQDVLKAGMKARIATQYGNANNTEEFTTIVADREASGLEFNHQAPLVGSRFVRILWVPFNGATFEFSLNADPQKAQAARVDLDALLLTLRSNENGPLEIVTRSDQS